MLAAGVASEWVGWCRAWYARAVLSPPSKRQVLYTLLQVGRWLARAHPTVTSPAQWDYDLAADLGVCWRPDAPELTGALQQIREAGLRAGKKTWMIGDGATNIKAGFSLLCIAEPIAFLEGALKSAVSGLKTSTEGGAKYEFGDNPI